MTNFRDIELLSVYLDGQLSPSDSARLETRLESEPNLRAIYDDLRAARNLLRQLPARKAPRNFTLTPKMVGQRPPMPRAYPVFRFATALATLLFFLTFATNFMTPRLARQASAPLAYGVGGGGGGEPPVQEALPAATEAPAQSTVESLALQPTAPAPSADTARVAETPTLEPYSKNLEPPQPAPQGPPPQPAPVISFAWQTGLLIAALVCGGIAWTLRLTALRKWRARK